ncbi:hypothetical protein APUTEX25_001755 [Auxenochlorella protothecoides]|nr:hypothetical protein APUTEX25_001755 [Auxenochlorella protothecoides]|eukprot:RMZ57555.1 hypothetical protein APUTEX25_001755 [Auxenochlorella protothecoides]
MDEFVRVRGTQFVVGCKTWYASGWNQWEAMEAGAGALELFGASLPNKTTGPQLVRDVLDRAQAKGVNVVRAWAQAVTPNYALETAPGQYNEAVFQGLDYLLDEARQRGIRLLLVLLDNWQPGGADTLANWAGSNVHEDFFSNADAKRLYQARAEAIVTRVNAINGRSYSEDPTIFAWDLINEPRCYRCGATTAAWASEMAAYVKSLDGNHLVTIGEEGFYPAGQAASAANPQGLQSWAFEEGQDFYADHNDPNIDFTAIHLWPDNWLDKTTDFVERWIAQHIQQAASLGKPMLLEEFGVYRSSGADTMRDQYYKLIYDLIQKDAESGGPSGGALFFQYYAPGQQAPSEEGGGITGVFGVVEADNTFPIIDAFTASMAQLTGKSVSQCSATSGVSVTAVRDCSYTQVNGRPGTGYEGPACDVDINECVRGTSGCAITGAACTNSAGGYTCACTLGYAGDGFSCNPTPTLDQLQLNYTTQGAAQLACDEGQDVKYPTGVPGFAYDPTGGLSRADGASDAMVSSGSSISVQPVDCMAACNEAPGCTAFSYNPSLQKCFLKTGSSYNTCQIDLGRSPPSLWTPDEPSLAKAASETAEAVCKLLGEAALAVLTDKAGESICEMLLLMSQLGLVEMKGKGEKMERLAQSLAPHFIPVCTDLFAKSTTSSGSRLHRSIASTLLDYVFGNRAAISVFGKEKSRLSALYETALGDISDASTQVDGTKKG